MEGKNKNVKQYLYSLSMECFGSLTQEVDVNTLLPPCILTCPHGNLNSGID